MTAAPDATFHDLVPLAACHAPIGTPAPSARALAMDAGYHPTWLDAEVPPRVVEVAAFAIDRHPVTNAQYERFVRATGHRRPLLWPQDVAPAGWGDRPVVGVDHEDAVSYAQWVGLRLPTEVEWERAARGPEGRWYPWGDDFMPRACCWQATEPAPVGAHPDGASGDGVMDLAGNVWEWCADRTTGTAAARGGSFRTSSPLWLRGAARLGATFALNRLDHVGFRCAADA